eukprot:GFYU01013652.1.p1 GENE.GFYU01013652.1~~GFYU01013652.1.p1  ORF type:complete len:605 (-),score=83.08 GFYU01013652.1:72-1886(-)
MSAPISQPQGDSTPQSPTQVHWTQAETTLQVAELGRRIEKLQVLAASAKSNEELLQSLAGKAAEYNIFLSELRNVASSRFPRGAKKIEPLPLSASAAMDCTRKSVGEFERYVASYGDQNFLKEKLFLKEAAREQETMLEYAGDVIKKLKKACTDTHTWYTRQMEGRGEPGVKLTDHHRASRRSSVDPSQVRGTSRSRPVSLSTNLPCANDSGQWDFERIMDVSPRAPATSGSFAVTPANWSLMLWSPMLLAMYRLWADTHAHGGYGHSKGATGRAVTRYPMGELIAALLVLMCHTTVFHSRVVNGWSRALLTLVGSIPAFMTLYAYRFNQGNESHVMLAYAVVASTSACLGMSLREQRVVLGGQSQWKLHHSDKPLSLFVSIGATVGVTSASVLLSGGATMFSMIGVFSMLVAGQYSARVGDRLLKRVGRPVVGNGLSYGRSSVSEANASEASTIDSSNRATPGGAARASHGGSPDTGVSGASGASKSELSRGERVVSTFITLILPLGSFIITGSGTFVLTAFVTSLLGAVSGAVLGLADMGFAHNFFGAMNSSTSVILAVFMTEAFSNPSKSLRTELCYLLLLGAHTCCVWLSLFQGNATNAT